MKMSVCNEPVIRKLHIVKTGSLQTDVFTKKTVQVCIFICYVDSITHTLQEHTLSREYVCLEYLFISITIDTTGTLLRDNYDLKLAKPIPLS
jgi:hypothetical protein